MPRPLPTILGSLFPFRWVDCSIYGNLLDLAVTLGKWRYDTGYRLCPRSHKSGFHSCRRRFTTTSWDWEKSIGPYKSAIRQYTGNHWSRDWSSTTSIPEADYCPRYLLFRWFPGLLTSRCIDCSILPVLHTNMVYKTLGFPSCPR